ncbi:putative H/ACA small nucleolar RNP component GAR1, partial [Pseudoloma neurophilia]
LFQNLNRCTTHRMAGPSYKRQYDRQPSERVFLGTFLRNIGNSTVLSLGSQIPLPNSRVFYRKEYTTVEEIFGKQKEVFCVIKGKYGDGKYEIEKNRLIAYNRLLDGETSKPKQNNMSNTQKPPGFKINQRKDVHFKKDAHVKNMQSRNKGSVFSRRSDQSKDGYTFSMKNKKHR